MDSSTIIKTTEEPLPDAAVAALRLLFQNKAYPTLLRVIEAHGKMHSANLANRAIETKDYAMKLADANEELRLAQRYMITLEVLKEISEQLKFSTTKLT